MLAYVSCVLKPVSAPANRVFSFDFWQKNSSVKELNLKYNEIGNEGATAIAKMLEVIAQRMVTLRQLFLI